MLNTKFDYDYIRDNSVDDWELTWRNLLEGRFVIAGNDLVEDSNAPIFRLGFTVEEVADAIEFSGYTTRETEWYQSQPNRYRLVDGTWKEIDGWKEEYTASKVAEAIGIKSSEIDAESRRRQALPISWNDRTWYADTWATKTIESCCAVATSLNMRDIDLVRVPTPLQAGCWLTADLDSSGNEIVATGITVADMRQLLAALYDRNGALWGKALVHKATLEAMAAEGATEEDIEAYDCTAGWK